MWQIRIPELPEAEPAIRSEFDLGNARAEYFNQVKEPYSEEIAERGISPDQVTVETQDDDCLIIRSKHNGQTWSYSSDQLEPFLSSLGLTRSQVDLYWLRDWDQTAYAKAQRLASDRRIQAFTRLEDAAAQITLHDDGDPEARGTADLWRLFRVTLRHYLSQSDDQIAKQPVPEGPC